MSPVDPEMRIFKMRISFNGILALMGCGAESLCQRRSGFLKTPLIDGVIFRGMDVGRKNDKRMSLSAEFLGHVDGMEAPHH